MDIEAEDEERGRGRARARKEEVSGAKDREGDVVATVNGGGEDSSEERDMEM